MTETERLRAETIKKLRQQVEIWAKERQAQGKKKERSLVVWKKLQSIPLPAPFPFHILKDKLRQIINEWGDPDPLTDWGKDLACTVLYDQWMEIST